MAFVEQESMPETTAIQAENERIIAEMHKAEQKGESLEVLRGQAIEQIEQMPMKVGVGSIVVLGLIYWFLIRR